MRGSRTLSGYALWRPWASWMTGLFRIRSNRGLSNLFPEPFMPKEFRTEAERKASPRPVPMPGQTLTTGRGQKRSLERGVATRSKKNPGKRPKKGG